MFKNFQTQFINTIQRFWFPLLFAALTCVQFIYIIAERTSWDSDITRMAFYTSLGIPLGFGVEFFEFKNTKSKGLAKLLVAIFIFLEMLWSLSFDTRKFFFTFANVFLLSHLFVALSFWFNSRSQNIDEKEKLSLFWKKNWDLFIGFQGSFLVNSVLYIGLVIAIVSINSLFKVNSTDKLPMYLLAFLCTVGGTFYLGAYLLGSEKEKHTDSKIVLTLVNFIFPFLQLTYFAILYLYLGKILMEQNLPRGYVGWLVSCLSVLVCLSHLIIKPNIEKGLVKPHSQFVWRYSFIALIPLLGLLSFAIFRRISDYGFTESRYLLLCLHLWMYGIAFSHFRPHKSKMQIIPLSLFIVTLITSLGPLSPSSVAFWSQKGRLLEAVRESQGRFENNQLLFPKEISTYGQKKILKTLHQVCQVYGVRQIYKMLEIKPTFSWQNYDDLYCFFQKGQNTSSDKPFAKLVVSLNLSIVEDGSFSYDEYYRGGDVIIENSSNFNYEIGENRFQIPDLKAEIQNLYISPYNKVYGHGQLTFKSTEKDQLQWTPEKGSSAPIDLIPIMDKLSKMKNDKNLKIDPKEYILNFENEETKLIIQINNINFNKESDNTFKIKSLSILAVAVRKN